VRDDRGFTMVELLVTVSLVSIVSVTLFNFLDQTTSVTSRIINDVETEQTAALALRTMTEDLRSATGIQACAAASYSTCVTFNIPRSATSGTTCPERQITYALVGTAIQESRFDYPSSCGTPTMILSAKPIISGVQNGASTAVFTYYDKNQNVIDAINAPASVPQAVAVSVTLHVSYRGGGSVVLNLSSTASLRNNR
jgi:prepilin-type N-terminal cleavage/methylation domain-containing protein